MSATNKKQRSGSRPLNKLPMSRIKTIMKCSPAVESIKKDALFLTAKSAELFISDVVSHAYKHAKKESRLDYNAISSYILSKHKMGFLAEVVPKKVKFKDCLEHIKKSSATMSSDEEPEVFERATKTEQKKKLTLESKSEGTSKIDKNSGYLIKCKDEEIKSESKAVAMFHEHFLKEGIKNPSTSESSSESKGLLMIKNVSPKRQATDPTAKPSGSTSKFPNQVNVENSLDSLHVNVNSGGKEMKAEAVDVAKLSPTTEITVITLSSDDEESMEEGSSDSC